MSDDSFGLPELGLPAPPWVVAHRGASAERPENTLASAALAVEQKADMLEIDVQLTTDGEILLAHDWEIEIDGTLVCIERTPSSELQALVGRDENTEDEKEGDRDTSPLPSLSHLLESLPADMPLNLELKRRHAPIESWCERLPRAIDSRPGVLLSSFDWDLLAALHTVLPGTPLAPIGSQRPHDLLQAAEDLSATTIHCHRRLAFSDFISAARASGWPVLVYTINEPDLAVSLVERGVAGLFTDRPAEMRRALDAR